MSEQLPPENLSPLCIMLFVTRKEHRLLEQTIASIKQQTCPKWKLIIVAPDQNAIKTDDFQVILNNQKAVKADVLFSTDAPHKIVDEVKSQYIIFLSLGDQLHQDFVHYFFQQKQQYVSLRLLYTDHSLLSKGLEKPVMHFKPDWNPDYLLSFNYISYAIVFSCDDLLRINDLLDAVEKDYFHQLLLVLTQQYTKDEIYHVAKPLFQLQGIDKKSPTETLLADYFSNNEAIYRHAFFLPNTMPLVSIVIPTKNQFKLLKQCIDSLLEKTSYPHFELLIIDNQSNDPVTLEYLEQLASIENIRILHYPHAFNYSAINNFAVKQSKGSLIALLNNDTEIIHSDWLTEIVTQACRPDIGCVGAKLIYPDGTIQHGGVILGIYGTASHAHKHFPNDHTGYFNRLITVHNVSAVTAACLVMRKDVFNQVGGFDEVNLKVAYNDVDLCLKVLQQGYRNLWTPYAELIHHESKSRGKKRSWWQRRKLNKEGLFLKKKWGSLLINDPAYNPNLTLNSEDFSLRKQKIVD